MFERILVPLDGSPRAEMVLDQLGPFLRRKGTVVLIARALLHHSLEPFRISGVDLGSLKRELHAEATVYLRKIVHQLSERGIQAVECLPEGPVPEAILEGARVHGATLIAMSTHGRTGLVRWVRGSVAEKVARMSPVPVFLAPSFQRNAESRKVPSVPAPLTLRRILVPQDGSPEGMAAIPAAAEFARCFGAEVVVLGVRGPSPIPVAKALDPQKELPQGDSLLDPALREFSRAALQATGSVLEGDPASEILDFAQEQHADLMVMTTHGWSGSGRRLLGSVTERVLRSVDLPLLLVQPASDKGP